MQPPYWPTITEKHCFHVDVAVFSYICVRLSTPVTQEAFHQTLTFSRNCFHAFNLAVQWGIYSHAGVFLFNVRFNLSLQLLTITNLYLYSLSTSLISLPPFKVPPLDITAGNLGSRSCNITTKRWVNNKSKVVIKRRNPGHLTWAEQILALAGSFCFFFFFGKKRGVPLKEEAVILKV